MQASDIEFGPQDRGGGEAVFQKLVDRYANDMFRLAFSLVGNAADAEDVVQEAYLRMFRGLAGFREEARFETWMHRIVVNTALNDLRRLGRFGELMDDEVSDAPAPDLVEQRAVERDALERGLAALPSGQRTVIVLKDVYGLSCREIGRELGIKEGAVKVRLHRARKRLRELLSNGRSDGEV